MGPKTLEAGNGLIQVEERLIWVERLVMEGDSGPGHVVGGFGAKLWQAWPERLRDLDARGFPSCCHAVPLDPRCEAPC